MTQITDLINSNTPIVLKDKLFNYVDQNRKTIEKVAKTALLMLTNLAINAAALTLFTFTVKATGIFIALTLLITIVTSGSCLCLNSVMRVWDKIT